ncbi:hypothetical protein PVA44_03495 [Entomospira nematocerorum]|uniref:Peptidase M50 domain-containing protein n=1 Tax=Entomospira nematocerorum TaxID=2719987 RepID=A0A968GET8_9SPIO|nr:hypothetical protein [Entomospira nematocera]NIZ46903.1 hypothetical protein [Entomospira nematocera]WDI33299.1 hypothetical protein PVA44_03495 [Entomospira nematocera]
MSVLGMLMSAMIVYILHDNAYYMIIRIFRKKQGTSKLPDVIHYFDIQRLALTYFLHYGWRSSESFLYENSEELRGGRVTVFFLQLLHPALYWMFSMIIVMIATQTSGMLPAFLRVYLQFMALFSFNMMILMLIPIPPLAMGNALMSFYASKKYQYQRKQIHFYGQILLVGLVITLALIGGGASLVEYFSTTLALGVEMLLDLMNR